MSEPVTEVWLQPPPEIKEHARRVCMDIAERGIRSPEETWEQNGTISLEWWHPSIAHLEIGRTRYSCYIKPDGGEPTMYFEGSSSEISKDLLDELESLLTR